MRDERSMKIYGVDFTSVPSSNKAITFVQCRLDEDGLSLEHFDLITSFDEFENFLMQPGPWLAGMDFPFGQPRRLIENIGWPPTWEGYVYHLSTLTKQEFVDMLATYRKGRYRGDKQHLRLTDKLANSRSPMMLYGVPVGKMFFEGAHRLLEAGVSIQPCCVRDDPRIVIEAYPALVARRWIGSRSYKTDEVKKQTIVKQGAREEIVHCLRSKETKEHFGFDVYCNDDYAENFIRDGSGDELDALLCAIQAAWAYTRRDQNYGIPVDCDPLEGWIVDPSLLSKSGIK
jgi:hypothetical protein